MIISEMLVIHLFITKICHCTPDVMLNTAILLAVTMLWQIFDLNKWIMSVGCDYLLYCPHFHLGPLSLIRNFWSILLQRSSSVCYSSWSAYIVWLNLSTNPIWKCSFWPAEVVKILIMYGMYFLQKVTTLRLLDKHRLFRNKRHICSCHNSRQI